MEVGRKKRISIDGESREAIWGQETGLSKGMEAGKRGAQMENGMSGGSTREGRTLQSRGQWAEGQEALNLALNPPWLWNMGPLSLTFLIYNR